METKFRFAPKKKQALYRDREFILLYAIIKKTGGYLKSKKRVCIVFLVLTLLSYLFYCNFLCFSYNEYREKFIFAKLLVYY